jgi:hypothetical protein
MIFSYESYYLEINKFINASETDDSLRINQDIKSAKLKQIKDQTVVLARIVAFYRTANILHFSQNIIKEICDIYVDCAFADTLSGSARLSGIQELRERYMAVANKMTAIINALNRQQ